MAARMTIVRLTALVVCLTVLLAHGVVADDASGKGSAEQKPVLRTVAVLGYEAKWLDDPAERKDAGEIMATVISDRLSATDDVVIVERNEFEKILQEQKLSLSGLVDESNRVRVGKLLGARFLIWGRGFKLGKQIYVTTKVINVETGQFKGIIVLMPTESGLGDVVAKVSDELIKKLPATVKALSPAKTKEISPIEMLKKCLGGAKKSWLIAAEEEHRRAEPVVVIDPAIRNELERILSGAEQTVKSLGKTAAKAVVEGNRKFSDFDKDKSADYYVTAEGFSEFGTRLSADMVTCVARVEIKIESARTGNVLVAGSIDSRAADLSEQLAGKQALRKGTRRLMLELAEKLSHKLTSKAAEKK